MSGSRPCDFKLKLYGKGRASDALIQHRITALGYEIFNCSGNSRLMRNKVPALQALRRRFLEALKNRSTRSSEESEDSDNEDTPTLRELEEKLTHINQVMVKNRRDRAFCHYQIARLEAEIGALYDAQDYYRVPWLRSTDEEDLEVLGYENTLVDEWIYGKLRDLKEQKKNFTEWRDELLYEAPKLRKDYYEVENTFCQEHDRLDQLRSVSKGQHQAQSHAEDRNHQRSPTSPPFITKTAKPKIAKLPFGLRHLYTFQRCEQATKECERATEGNPDIFTPRCTDDSSTISSIE
ncbi:hypothetical protein QAD02_021050 [Eretmocerus hayati]|uniref:Uncharacterized protein n=1 Tax=Eretmocerus hayati TaxID=131215 RepID=A0ACC2PSC6_9HYME|nr:hypothetical protein QAD02_021050 [Eretmocerus hayati]